MRSFYYPIYSRDFAFENIFSSESISPPYFYSLRGFGIDYWRTMPKFQSENAIVLFESPPSIDIEDQGSDVVRCIVQIFEIGLNASDLLEIGNGIYAYPKTIYLTKNNFKVLFFSDRDRKLTIMRSEVSLPTKDLVKYKNNFELLNESSCKVYSEEEIRHTNFGVLVDELNFDRKYNAFKGLIYGLGVGLLTNDVPQELVLKKRLRELTNRFAELKNRVESQISSPWSRSKEQEGILALVKELKYLVIKTEDLFLSVFPEQDVSIDELAQFVFKKFENKLHSIERAKRYVEDKMVDDALFGRNDYQALLSIYYRSVEKTSLSSAFPRLKQLLEDYIFGADSSEKLHSRRERANQIFKDVLRSIDSYIDKQITLRSVGKNFDFTSVHYEQITHQIQIDSKAFDLNESLTEELVALSNIILRNPKSGKGHTSKDLLLSIIEQAGVTLSNNQKSTALYKYLNNQVTTYSFDGIASPVAKNFVAFAFNPDSLEKLAAFNQAKNIDQQWISYMFWCGFNGFANISKNFLRPVFGVDSSDLQDSIDTYLSQYLINHGSRSGSNNILQVGEQVEVYYADAQTQNEDDQLEKFYDAYISSFHTMSLNEFKKLAVITDQNKFVDALKLKHGISKKNAIKLFETLGDFLHSNRLLL